MVGVGVSGCVGVKLNNSNELTKGPDSWFYGVSGPEREVSQNPVLVDTVVSEMSLEKKKEEEEIHSVSGSYSFAAVDTLSPQFLLWRRKRRKVEEK